MRQIEQRALESYRQQFHAEPALVASAPGRVNLIGEHTDYNGGFVLPCAIDRRVAVAVGPGGWSQEATTEVGGRATTRDRPYNDPTRPSPSDPFSYLYSDDFHEHRPLVGQKEGSWADYPSGVVWAMHEQGYNVPVFLGAFAGDVPLASGLSSSAAIEAATALALAALAHLDIAREDLALLCQRAENAFVGVNSGIMDQYASLLCQAEMALLIDCRSLEAQHIPLDLAGAGLTLLVCDTRVSRQLSATGYNERRRVTEQVALTLGVKDLRGARLEDLDKLSGEELKRARHVVTENARVLEAVQTLYKHDFAQFGQLMYASHRSLRDDYEVSTAELDTFVDVAASSGALGARLTGAGFGGCAIALVTQKHAQQLASSVQQNFKAHAFKEPVFYTFQPAAGAEIAFT